jgi:acetylornithine deacetylase/succinyl-diaminopimelate desuccinylase-like protein
MTKLGLVATVALMLAASGVARADSNLPPPEWQTLGRSILKELIEIDSTHANGSTGVAHAIEARLLAAGFAKSDIAFLAPPDHPSKGNIVVRLRGKGLAKPVLYICHLDVVEAEAKDWTFDPFKLTEKDGWLYGRGTIDMKGQDTATLTALIRLKKEGFVPDRDIIVAFTADEEAGGDANGVQWLMQTHRDLVDAAFVINPDSGEPVTKNGRKLYMGVQTSEKEYMTFGWEATDKGGHSSRPTPANPIYHVAAAVERLSKFQFPLHLTDTTKQYFAIRATKETGQVQQDMKAVGDGAADAAAIARLSSVVETNIMLRSTCVATQFNGGRSESALPVDAKAVIQCRIIPGESEDTIEKTLTGIADDPAIKLSVIYPPDISPESPLDPKVMGEVKRLTDAMWPGVVILPEMSPGASDSAFSRAAGIPSYGVDGIFQDLDDSRAHGRDERVGIVAFNEGLEFSYRLMKDLGEMKS